MTETTPTTTPAKKGHWKIIGPIVAVLVVLAAGFYTVVMPALDDAKYKAGACIDFFPPDDAVGTTTLDEKPKLVDCSDAAAQAKIVAVFEEKTLNDATTSCPSAETTAAIELKASSFLSKQRLLCLTEV